MSGFFRFPAHFLNGLHQVGLLVVVGVAEFGSPRKIFIKVAQHGGKLRQGLHAGIPILFVDRVSQVLAFEVGIFLQEPLRLDNLRRIGRRRKNLGQQSVGIQRNRSDQLLQLFGT